MKLLESRNHVCSRRVWWILLGGSKEPSDSGAWKYLLGGEGDHRVSIVTSLQPNLMTHGLKASVSRWCREGAFLYLKLTIRYPMCLMCLLNLLIEPLHSNGVHNSIRNTM